MGNWIMAFFGGSLALISFFSIFAAGAIITLSSLLFGGDADGGVEFHGDHGGDFGGDHGHDGGSDHGGEGPGIFSVQGMSLLMTGFGGVSFITQYATGNLIFSSVAGLMFGWVFAISLLVVLKASIRQQASSHITSAQIVGSSGVVTTSIPSRGPGEVSLVVSGSQRSMMAFAEGERQIPRGSSIRVIRYQGDSVVVGEA